MSDHETIRVFDGDVEVHDGYVYTTNQKLSSQLARAHWIVTLTDLTNMRDRKVLDLGCGDGYFSCLLYDAAPPETMTAIDPSPNAIKSAIAKRGDRRIEFSVGDGHSLDFEDKVFDVVLIQGVLHHDNDPADLVREACRVAHEVVILEPNGYNPVLKVLERTSRYHREHNEKSYRPSSIDRWLTDAGGQVVHRTYINLVPVFAPDALARVCKRLEPIVEALPGVRRVCLGQYIVKARVG